MEIEQYGVTWWGKEWLKTLSIIDPENRMTLDKLWVCCIVHKITITKNVISAEIIGNGRAHPRLTVTIVLPPFSADEISRFLDALTQRPAIIGKLLNREMDKEVLTIAVECGLKLFPSQLSDIELQCSCPDLVMPCEHIAAIIYWTTHMIDLDPFLIFQMHCVDLIEELRKRGFPVDAATNIEVPEYVSTLDLLPQDHERPSSQQNVGEVETNMPLHAQDTFIDFSKLEDIGDLLVGMLAESPAFCTDRDFREVYSRYIKAVAQRLNRILDGKVTLEGSLRNQNNQYRYPVTRQTTMVLRCSNSFQVMLEDIDDVEPYTESIIAAMLSLQEIDADALPDYQPSVQAMHAAMMCAMHLLRHGAVYPAIVKYKQAEKTEYGIVWHPATFDGRVKTVVDAVESLFISKDVVFLDIDQKHQQAFAHPGRMVISAMLSTLMYHMNHSFISPLVGLFFCDDRLSFSSSPQIPVNKIPVNIKAWLEPFSIGSVTSMTLILIISEPEHGRFDLTIKVKQNVNDGTSRMATLHEVEFDAQWADKRMEIYKKLSLLAHLVGKGIDSYVNHNGTEPLHFDLNTIVPFLFESLPVIRMLGLGVMMPRSLKNITRPKVSGYVSVADDSKPGSFNFQSLLNFEWRIALGDMTVTAEEFKQLTENATGLIKYKGQYFYADASDIVQLYNEMANTKPLKGTLALQAALCGARGDALVKIDNNAQAIIDKLKEPTRVKLPRGINATLRPYQVRGYEWMYRNHQLGLGCILADDMGLGKTLQVITLITKLKEEGQLKKEKVLIVVPTGLIYNWQQEITRFAPGVTYDVYHGVNRNFKEFDADIMITSFGVMRSDAKILSKGKWALMVIDEAQNIKNSSTQQSQAVNTIKAGTRIAMSGTPVENRLSEFWSIMDYANKGFLGTRKQFDMDYARPIQVFGDIERAEKFKAVTSPFLMRRLKTDRSIINDLPDKIEQNDYLRLTPTQASLYESTLQECMAAIENISGDSPQQLFKREGLVLQMVLALKQICNHPALFLKDENHSPELSGKCLMLLDLVDSIIASGEKALIFTQFTMMGEILQKVLSNHTGIIPLFYHGGCTIKQRNAITERFQNNRADQLLILSLKAAGTGLNLTAASHVIHFDLWWNPAVEAQATDRAYRIGQHKNVLVHRFITKDTFEERIDNMIQQKKGLANLTVATGENWIGKLSDEEIRQIFQSKESS